MKAMILFDVNEKEIGDGLVMIMGRFGTIIFEKDGIRPLPELKDIGYPNDDYDVGFASGWDACLKEIQK